MSGPSFGTGYGFDGTGSTLPSGYLTGSTGSNDNSSGFNIGSIVPLIGAGLTYAGTSQQQQAAQAALQQLTNMATQAYNQAGENLQQKATAYGNQAAVNLGNMLTNEAGGPTDIFNQALSGGKGNANFTPGTGNYGGLVPGTGTITNPAPLVTAAGTPTGSTTTTPASSFASRVT